MDEATVTRTVQSIPPEYHRYLSAKETQALLSEGKITEREETLIRLFARYRALNHQGVDWEKDSEMQRLASLL
jgi:hypothetical protein